MSLEFRVVVEDDGRIYAFDADGKELFTVAGMILADRLMEQYELQGIYIYLAYRDGLYKIGISEDIHRRERELKAQIVHWIRVAEHKARVFEAALHAMFREHAVGHEWFAFPNTEQYEALRAIETQRELREFLFKHHKAYYESHPGDWESGVVLEKLDQMGVYDLKWLAWKD